MRSPSLLLGALALLASSPGCERRSGGSAAAISDELILQGKVETARRTLDEIRDTRRRGRNIYADCKTMELVFYKDLRRLRTPETKKLLADLQQVCKDVPPQ